MKGKITKINSGNYYIDFHNDKPVRARGLFRHQGITPLVGDQVEYTANGFITKIFDRKNQLIRPKVANVDQVVVVTSLNEPKFKYYLLNKTLMMIEAMQIHPIIFFSKKDIAVDSYLKEYLDQGYEAYEFSNIDESNIKTLKTVFKNKLTVLMGQTGVGKSTTINTLFGLNLKTQKISKALNRGKHTTRIVEIYDFNDCEIIDTPGFSSFEHQISLSEMPKGFRDFRKFSFRCQFRNCLHYKEIKCEIKRQVELGKISINRYNDYIKMLKEKLDAK